MAKSTKKDKPKENVREVTEVKEEKIDKEDKVNPEMVEGFSRSIPNTPGENLIEVRYKNGHLVLWNRTVQDNLGGFMDNISMIFVPDPLTG